MPFRSEKLLPLLVFVNSEYAEVQIPTGAGKMKSLSGNYSDQMDWNLDMSVALDRTPPNTENPFFPMTFVGFMRGIGGFTANIPVSGGSYDFYTGKLAVFYDESRVLVGHHLQDCLKFRIMSKGFGMRYFGLNERGFCER